MSRSSEGHASGSNSNIGEIDEKLQNVSVDDRDGDDDDDDDRNDGNVDGNHDDDGDDDDGDSTSEHEQSSTLSHANYFDEPSLHLNNLNHLFHIDFMRSMQNLRTHEKRLAKLERNQHDTRAPILFHCLHVCKLDFFLCFFASPDSKMVHVGVQHLRMKKCAKLNAKIRFY